MDVGGEETSIRIPLANLKLIETSGQKSRFKILEMLDKKKFKKILMIIKRHNLVVGPGIQMIRFMEQKLVNLHGMLMVKWKNF